jgi:hypothetical protein
MLVNIENYIRTSHINQGSVRDVVNGLDRHRRCAVAEAWRVHCVLDCDNLGRYQSIVYSQIARFSMKRTAPHALPEHL